MLESELKKLTEAVTLNTEALNKLLEAGVSVEKETKVKPVKEKKAAAKTKDTPKTAAKKVVKEEQKSLFEEQKSDEPTSTPQEAAAGPTGSAPTTNGSEYYLWCVKICNQLSSHTGDPTLVAGMANHLGIKQMSKHTDMQLVPLVEAVTKALETAGVTPGE